MATWGDWRIGTGEREAAAAALADHYAAGRLTVDEFRARLDAAYAAVTAGELAHVTADLPTVGVTAAPRAARVRRRRRLARPFALFTAAAAAFFIGLVALVAAEVPNGGVVALALGLMAAPVLLLAVLAGVVFWAGRRAWRSGAWLEGVPLALGAPWLGRLVWAGRAFLVGRAFWRFGQRARGPRHRRARLGRPGYPEGA